MVVLPAPGVPTRPIRTLTVVPGARSERAAEVWAWYVVLEPVATVTV